LVAPAVCALAEKGPWEGTATQLLERLAQDNAEAAKKKDWPQSPQGLANVLRRLAPNLRGMGVLVDFGRDSTKKRARKITISQREQPKEQPEEPASEKPGEQQEEQTGKSSSEASGASEPQQNQGPRRTMPDDLQASSDAPSQEPDEKASEPNIKDSKDLSDRRTILDASDDKIPAYSNGNANLRRTHLTPQAAWEEEPDDAEAGQACRYCHRSGCVLTPWGQECRFSEEDKLRWDARQASADDAEASRMEEEERRAMREEAEENPAFDPQSEADAEVL
jgi:hypothetical protein